MNKPILKNFSLLEECGASAGSPLDHASISPADTVAFSEAGLARIASVIEEDARNARIPGAAMLIARNGQIAFQSAVGIQDPQTGTPMMLDSIFRIYSMTKPIVSVAVMMMVEEGKLLIGDPVSKYFPELKDLQVGIEKTGPDGKPMLELVPCDREMTVQDLLRHTSGLTYGIFGTSLVKQIYLVSGAESRPANERLIKCLAKLPLAYQPGTVWEYSRSTDVLGALLERLSGTTLDAHLRQRIFDPLGMTDTGFWVEPSAHHRIAEPFAIDPVTGRRVRLIDARIRPKSLSGGGGLVSTLRDYYRFLHMLLNGGELDGVRLLSSKTVQYMTSDHLGQIPGAASGPDYLPGAGHGFGLGFAVRIADGGAVAAGTVGEYSWSGLSGTFFWVDPQEKLIAIFLIQAPDHLEYYKSVFRSLVYAALD